MLKSFLFYLFVLDIEPRAKKDNKKSNQEAEEEQRKQEGEHSLPSTAVNRRVLGGLMVQTAHPKKIISSLPKKQRQVLQKLQKQQRVKEGIS